MLLIHFRVSTGSHTATNSVSVAANIAEGSARRHRRELLQFLSIARGSLAELHTLHVIARRLCLAREAEFDPVDELLDHTGRTLTLLIRSVEQPDQ